MKFLFTVTETLYDTIEIDAENEEEAYKKGVDLYRDGKIVLDKSDLFFVDFETANYPETYDAEPFFDNKDEGSL